MNIFKKNDKENIIAVLLRHDEGEGYLFEVNNTSQNVQITDTRAFKYSNGWENLTYDIDELLFNIENDRHIEIKKSVFFIYSHLIDLKTREINPSYKDILAKIIKDNDIEALGYLEMDQVVLKYLEKKEQNSLSAIIVEIDIPAVSVFIYQVGTLVFSESVARTENIVSDLNEIFHHTSKDSILPTRLVLYDAGGLKDEASEIISHKWPKDTFIHVPKVEILNENDLHNSLIAAYKSEIIGTSARTVSTITATPEDTYGEEEESEQQPAPVDLGFIIGADVKKEKIPEPIIISEPPVDTQPTDVQEMITPSKKFNVPKIPISFMLNKKFAIVAVLLSILLFSMIAALYYAHSASLTLYYDKVTIDETVDYDEASFIEKKTEKIQTESSTKTTGTKKIGEKAEGKITIFNATESDKTFKKGTKIIASNKLEFFTESDVTVKAATKTVTSGGDILTTTSKETAEAIAADIGTSYNISKDTKFTFEGSSETTYFAKANDAFTGGTEKEVQTASKDDFERLKSELDEEVNKKKADSLKKNADSRKIINQLTEVVIVNEDYSKEIAEEAKTLDAEVTAEVTYYLYDEEQAKSAIIDTLRKEVPKNYSLTPDNITFSIKSAEKTDETITVSFEVTALPTYNINTKQVISKIKGSSSSSVEKKIKEVTDIKGYTIDISSPLPFLKYFTPLFEKNYKITLEPLE